MVRYGIYLFASIFDVPVASTNFIPYGECGRKSSDIFIVKKCINTLTGNLIPIKKLIDTGMTGDWFTEEEIFSFEKKNIAFVENNSEEIKDLAAEMNERIDGSWIKKSEEDDLQYSG